MKKALQTMIGILILLLFLVPTYISYWLDSRIESLTQEISAAENRKAEIIHDISNLEVLRDSRIQVTADKVPDAQGDISKQKRLDELQKKQAELEREPDGITTKTVSGHSSKSDCWIILFGKVYDITSLVRSHSGGDVFECGNDLSELYESHHGKSLSIMEKYYVGDLS